MYTSIIIIYTNREIFLIGNYRTTQVGTYGEQIEMTQVRHNSEVTFIWTTILYIGKVNVPIYSIPTVRQSTFCFKKIFVMKSEFIDDGRSEQMVEF